MRRDEDVLDVLCLWGRILWLVSTSAPTAFDQLGEQRTLIFVAPLTDFSKELDMMQHQERGTSRRGNC